MSDPSRRILANSSQILLASADCIGTPHASSVPFGLLEHGFGIVLSRYSAHARNLLERRRANVFLVPDDPPDDDTGVLGDRIGFDVVACHVPRGSDVADAVWHALEARHGAAIAAQRILRDVQTIVLYPVCASHAAAADRLGDPAFNRLRVARRLYSRRN